MKYRKYTRIYTNIHARTPKTDKNAYLCGNLKQNRYGSCPATIGQTARRRHARNTYALYIRRSRQPAHWLAYIRACGALECIDATTHRPTPCLARTDRDTADKPPNRRPAPSSTRRIRPPTCGGRDTDKGLAQPPALSTCSEHTPMRNISAHTASLSLVSSPAYLSDTRRHCTTR